MKKFNIGDNVFHLGRNRILSGKIKDGVSSDIYYTIHDGEYIHQVGVGSVYKTEFEAYQHLVWRSFTIDLDLVEERYPHFHKRMKLQENLKRLKVND